VRAVLADWVWEDVRRVKQGVPSLGGAWNLLLFIPRNGVGAEHFGCVGREDSS
jgi:hypothetical protein